MASSGQQAFTLPSVPLAAGPVSSLSTSNLLEPDLSGIDLDLRIKSKWWKDLRDLSGKKRAEKLGAVWGEMSRPSDFDIEVKAALEATEKKIESLRTMQRSIPPWNFIAVRNNNKQLEEAIIKYKVSASEPMKMLQTAGQNAASRHHHHSMPSWSSAPAPSMTSASTNLNLVVVSQGRPSSSAAPPMAFVDSPFHSGSQPGSPTASGGFHICMTEPNVEVNAIAGSSPRHPVLDAEGGTSAVTPNWQDANGETRRAASPVGSSASPPTPYADFQAWMGATSGEDSGNAWSARAELFKPGLVSQGSRSSSTAAPIGSMESPSSYHSESRPRSPIASGSSSHRPVFDREGRLSTMDVPNWQNADGGPWASPPTDHAASRKHHQSTPIWGSAPPPSNSAPTYLNHGFLSQGPPSSSTAPPMASMDSPFPYHSHSRPGNWQDANGERRLMASRSASPPTPYPGFQGEMAPTFGSSPPQGYETRGAVFYGAHGAPSAPTTVIHNHHTHNYAGPALFPGASGQRDFHIDYRSVDGNYYDTHFNGGTLTVESRSPTQTPFRPIPAMVTNGLPGSPPLPLSDSPTEETSILHVKPLPDGDERLLLLERAAAELSQSAALPDLADAAACDLKSLVDWLRIVPVEKGKRVLYLSRKTTVECDQFEEVARYVGEACATSNLPSFPLLMGLESISPDSIVPRIADGLYESFPAFRRHWETTYPDYRRPIAYLDGMLPGEGIVPSQNQFQHYISKVFDYIPEDERLPILVLIIGLDNRSSVKMRKHVNQCMLDCMRSTHMLFIVAGKKSIAVQDMLQEMRSTSLGISVDT
ncbi:hypothetical protein DFP72DRAFT_1167783, partial [Ephemerocybe angulata]